MFHEKTQETGPLYGRLVPLIKGKRAFSKIQVNKQLVPLINIMVNNLSPLIKGQAAFSRTQVNNWYPLINIKINFLSPSSRVGGTSARCR